jgi:hypothetical protein
MLKNTDGYTIIKDKSYSFFITTLNPFKTKDLFTKDKLLRGKGGDLNTSLLC